MKFHKYHALGNDYVVIEAPFEVAPSIDLIKKICDRHRGLGSDGILIGKSDGNGFALRIFNPDGSEAEKSGNGLRIFARYAWDCGLVNHRAFSVRTKGGDVRCEVRDGGSNVFVEMGRARFDSQSIPVRGASREVVGEWLEIDGERLQFTALTIGNPHCVIMIDEPSSALALRLGPKIETHPLFPNRTNVQFVKALDEHRLSIQIWERGAGYTLASGSSSCAAAAAAVKLKQCTTPVSVTMPGGTIEIEVLPDYSITMLGAVEKIADGQLAPELIAVTRNS